MSASIAIARTALALRDLLIAALRNDPGWQLVHEAPRITTLPHGKPDQGSGQRLNLALVGVSYDREARNDAPTGTMALELRFLITAHVFLQLHSELLIGAALQAIHDAPLLSLSNAPLSSDTPLERELKAAGSIGDGATVRLVVDAASHGDFAGLRLPALLVCVGPLMVARGNGGSGLLIGK